MRDNEISTAPKLAALIRNTGPVPTQAISRPAIPGPTIRAALNVALLRPTALGRCSCGTISLTKVCRAGLSSAVTTPSRRANTKTIHSCATPVTTSAPSPKARRPRPHCVIISRRRFCIRSAMRPPYGASSSIGRNCRPVVIPTASAEWSVRMVRTSQSWATRCIQVPMLDTIAPDSHSR